MHGFIFLCRRRAFSSPCPFFSKFVLTSSTALGVVIEQGIKGTVLSYVGAIFGYVNWVLLFPLYMDKAEMGFVRVLFDSSLLLSTIFGFGLPQAIIRFYPYAKSRFDRNFFASYGLISILAGLIFLVFFAAFGSYIEAFFSERASLFNTYLWTLVPIVLLSLVYDFFEAMNRTRLNIASTIFIKEVLFRLLTMVIIIGFGQKWYDFDTLAALLVLIYGVMALSAAFVFFRKWSPDETSSLKPYRLPKDQVNYISLILFSSGGAVIINQIDLVMTGGMQGLEYAAVYGIAVFISSVVYMPFRSVTSIMTSVVSKCFALGDIDGLRKLYKSSSSNLFLIGGFLFLGIWLNIDFVFSLIPDDKVSVVKFSDGRWVFFILGISRLYDMLMGINGTILVQSPYYRSNIVLMPAIAVITVLLNLWLIPHWGINGAALSALISGVLFNTVPFIILWTKLKMQPIDGKNLVAISLFLAVLATGFLVKFENHFLQMFFSTVLIFMGYVLPAYRWGFSPEINGRVQKWFPFLKKFDKAIK